MILYNCETCGFGIAGSHPETAEDEYELRQDIDEHEERHRREGTDSQTTTGITTGPADADEVLQEMAERGAVILPAPQKPLTAEDVRAIVREELERALEQLTKRERIGGDS